MKNHLLLFLCCLGLWSCSKDAVTKSPKQAADVYVAGYEWGPILPSGQLHSSYSAAKYWKNGIAFNLTLTDGTQSASASSIAVSGIDVYVAGSVANDYASTLNPPEIATYWKNGHAITLAGGTGANSIAISGTDIYVAGYGYEGGGTVAKYWKNGIAVNLEQNAYASSIAVSGADVYVAGYRGAPYKGTMGGYPPTYSAAKYWKNGVGVLTDDPNESQAWSIAISGTDVYMAGGGGYNNPASTGVARYWKNDHRIYLPVSNSSVARSIAVSGTDVYAAGSEGSFDTWITVAKYWKNGEAITLTEGTNATSITISGTDIYVAGYTNDYAGSVAKYWKNGSAVKLSDGSKSNFTSSIFVVEK